MAYDGSLKFDTAMDASGFQKGANQMDSIVKGLGVFKIIEKGMELVASSIDSAVSRVDTLNKFPRVMEQMGYGADAAKKSITKLSDGIQGLPTTLDGIVGSTQRLTIATGDLGKGTDSALALNNALLASGASAEAASRGTEQYIQSLSRGKIEGEEWKTLMETMPYAMQEVANGFGFTGTNAIQALRAAMSEGQITMTQFNDKLTELNGGVGGFAEVAQTASGGIGTAWSNIQTAVTRGVANVIQAVDSGLASFGGIAGVLSGVRIVVDTTFTALAGGATLLMENLNGLAFAAATVGTAFAAYKGLQAWNTAVRTAAASSAELIEKGLALSFSFDKEALSNARATAEELRGIAISQQARAQKLKMIATQAKASASAMTESAMHATGEASLDAATRAAQMNAVAKGAQKDATMAATLAKSAETAATKAETVAQGMANTQVGLGTALVGYLTGAYTVNQLAAAAAATVTTLFGMALRALPFVGIAAAIVAVVAGLIALVKWVAAGSKEFQAQKQAVEDLTTAQEELAQSTGESEDTFASSSEKMAANAKVSKTLVGTLKSVSSSTENASQKSKKMQATVAQLNATVEGLNIAYDEETGAIRNVNSGQEISIGQLEQLVDAKAELAKANAWQERANELVKEQVEIQENLAVIESKKQEILNNNALSTWEQNKLIKELDVSAAGYATSMEDVETRLAIVNGNLSTASTDMAQAVEDDYKRIEEAVTGSGETVEAVAARWGISADSIKAAWANAGGSFDAFVSAQDEALGHAHETFAGYVDVVTDGFSEMEQKSAISLDAYNENLQKNALATLNWAQNMETIMKLGVHEGVVQDLAELGPESALQLQTFVDGLTALNDGADITLGQVNETVKNKIAEVGRSFDEGLVATSAAAKATLGAESYVAAGAASIDNISMGIAGNPAAETAMTQKMDAVKNAAGTVDFTPVGQTAGTGVTTGIAGSVQSGTPIVTGAVSSMAAAVGTTVDAMAAQTQTSAGQMMQQIDGAVTANASIVTASFSACTQAIVTLLTDMNTTVQELIQEMMTGIDTAITTAAQTVIASASTLATGVIDCLTPMVKNAGTIAGSMMDGMAAAMQNKAEGLYQQAREIAATISTTLANAFNVQAPATGKGGSASRISKSASAVYSSMEEKSGMLYHAPEPISMAGFGEFSASPEALMSTSMQMRTMMNTAQLHAQQRMAQIEGTSMRSGFAAQTSDRGEKVEGQRDFPSGELHGKLTAPIVVQLDGRETYKAIKEVETTWGYNVGGMSYAW